MSDLIIAIDGPAGAGKSTVAKRLAKELGLAFLDTGAMYRAIALKAHRNGLGPDDGEQAGLLAAASTIRFEAGEPQRVFLDDEDITSLIRTPEIGELASALSAHTPVRRVLAERQKEAVRQGGYTLEGRDTTTVIAPQARVRVFLTASLEERTKRRFQELEDKGTFVDRNALMQQIADRDHRDSNREDSPLLLVDGVTEIVTDKMSIEEVIKAIRQLL